MRDYKTDLKLLLGVVGRLPGLRALLQYPAIRRQLVKLPGSQYLYTGIFRPHPFDDLHGTDTRGAEMPRDFAVDESVRASAHAYLGSQPNVIRLALGYLPDLDGFTFLDLGCGKGRPLFVASEFPFGDILGVELSPHLAEIARRNAAIMARRYPQRTAVRIEVADASAFALPSGNLVLFMYHPFGSDLVAKVVSQVEAALAREERSIYIVYYNPVGGRCFDASPLLRRRFAGMLAYAEEERGYGLDLTEDPVVIWQGGRAPAPTLSTDLKIVVGAGGMGARLEP